MASRQLACCAVSGSVPAQIKCGTELFRVGRREEAETWFDAAVVGGSAQYRSGDIERVIASNLKPGLKARQRNDRVHAAERWYRRSFELGSDVAAVFLGLLLRQVGARNEADQWIERAVERSEGHAAYDLDTILRGRRMTRLSLDEAAFSARWLRRGAELGNKPSMTTYAEAFRWYEVAAHHPQAHAADLIVLAVLHANGLGTPPEPSGRNLRSHCREGQEVGRRRHHDSSHDGQAGKAAQQARREEAVKADENPGILLTAPGNRPAGRRSSPRPAVAVLELLAGAARARRVARDALPGRGVLRVDRLGPRAGQA